MREVRAGFQARKIPYDTSLATLELAELLLQQGETGEVKALAVEMLATFAEQRVMTAMIPENCGSLTPAARLSPPRGTFALPPFRVLWQRFSDFILQRRAGSQPFQE